MLYEAYLDRNLGYEDRILYCFSAMVFVNAHKFYVAHRTDASWGENGICSEVERRDINYMAAALPITLAYYILEGVTAPYQPWTFGKRDPLMTLR